MTEPRPRLHEVGNVYVTGSAMIAFARFADLQNEPEEARRTLTRFLCRARQTREKRGDTPGQWRRRNSRWDILATVTFDDHPLAVVTYVHCRRA